MTQASVSIPPLKTATYEIREISRGGMFLAFKVPGSLPQVEKADIVVGANAEIAFAALIEGQRQQLTVRARIARITKQGIGFQFFARNPPQLGALRPFFSNIVAESGAKILQPEAIAKTQVRRMIQKPADDTGWQDWTLED